MAASWTWHIGSRWWGNWLQFNYEHTPAASGPLDKFFYSYCACHSIFPVGRILRRADARGQSESTISERRLLASSGSFTAITCSRLRGVLRRPGASPCQTVSGRSRHFRLRTRRAIWPEPRTAWRTYRHRRKSLCAMHFILAYAKVRTGGPNIAPRRGHLRMTGCTSVESAGGSRQPPSATCKMQSKQLQPIRSTTCASAHYPAVF